MLDVMFTLWGQAILVLIKSLEDSKFL